MQFSIAFVLLSLLASCVFAQSTPPAAEAPGLDRAFVTLPYAELRALWEAGQRKPEAEKIETPPVAHVLHRADCDLRLGDRSSVLIAALEVESLQSHWQSIPLLGGGLSLAKAEAASGSVIVQDKEYALLTNKPGKIPVTLQLSTRGAKELTSESPLSIKFADSAVKRLRISGIPAGMEARVDGQPADEIKDGVAIFSLASAAGEVHVAIAAPRVEAPRVETPITASHWQVQSQVLVRYTEGRLRYRSQVFARADDGSGLEMTMGIPANASAVAVNGQDIAGWTQTRTAAGTRTITIKWKTRDVLDRELLVEYATPQSPMAEQWALQAPSAAEQPDAKNLYVMLSSEGLELKGDGIQSGIEMRRLPEWMRKEIGGSAFVTAEAGNQLGLSPKWLPAVATAEAIVTESKCDLRLVADGSLQTTANYVIRHTTPLVWRLELPAGVQLLTCTVAGRAARPVQREAGAIELNLSTPEDSAKGCTNVALVYTGRIKALDPVSGEIALELPQTPLFIERLNWGIEIPEVFEVTAADGNLAVVAGDKPDARQLTLRKDFCRAERPKVALFYQRRSLQN